MAKIDPANDARWSLQCALRDKAGAESDVAFLNVKIGDAQRRLDRAIEREQACREKLRALGAQT